MQDYIMRENSSGPYPTLCTPDREWVTITMDVILYVLHWRINFGERSHWLGTPCTQLYYNVWPPPREVHWNLPAESCAQNSRFA